MSLTSEQVHLFRHNGFHKLKNRLPEELVEKLKEAIWRNIREEVEPVVRDAEGRIIRLSGVVDRDPVFLKTATCPLVLDPLESLLGPNIELIKNRHNHATLRRASEHRPEGLHRDVRQWSRTIFTVIFYLEETTVENGCTQVVPGSHHFPGVKGRLYDESVTRQLLEQAVPVPMSEGGMLVIDSMIMHGVGRNRTDGTRMSMTMGYHSVDEIADLENPHRMLVRGERPYDGNVPRRQ
ncbi:MAG: phytanoyl-CoA dioxygenase family protein [Candidatus Latescibacteria bacterium]|nr:phytanoyl-CoA dioxygenase family protein [Candidatus Latescibacterota bacterium]